MEKMYWPSFLAQRKNLLHPFRPVWIQSPSKIFHLPESKILCKIIGTNNVQHKNTMKGAIVFLTNWLSFHLNNFRPKMSKNDWSDDGWRGKRGRKESCEGARVLKHASYSTKMGMRMVKAKMRAWTTHIHTSLPSPRKKGKKILEKHPLHFVHQNHFNGATSLRKQ